MITLPEGRHGSRRPPRQPHLLLQVGEPRQHDPRYLDLAAEQVMVVKAVAAAKQPAPAKG
jgi:hypothetical protein